MNVWQELALASTRDVREIKRAYAKRLKQTNPADDPEGFQRLRGAYEVALKIAEQAETLDRPEEEEEGDEGAGQEQVFEREPEFEPDSSSPHADPRRFTDDRGPVDPAGPSLPSLRERARLAAAELCEQVLAQPTKETRAVLLREKLRQPDWELIDFRAALEEALIVLAYNEFERLWPLLDNFSEAFAWQRGTMFGDGNDELLNELLARQGARKWRRTIERDSNKLQIEALALLTKPPDEPAFRRFTRWDSNLKAMRELLAVLHTTRTDVLRFEANAASVRWWLTKFNSEPKPKPQPGSGVYWLLGWILLPPLAMWFVVAMLEPFIGVVPEPPGTLFNVLLGLSYGIPIGLKLVYKHFGRELAERILPRIHKRLHRLRTERTSRDIAIALTAAVIILSIGADYDRRFLCAAVLAALLFAFWFGFEFAVATWLLYAWPLHLLIAAAVQPLYRYLPQALKLGPVPPVAVFPHVLASFLFVPFAVSCRWIWKRLRQPPSSSPAKHAFYGSIAMTVAMFVGVALVHLANNPPQASQSPVSSNDAYLKPTWRKPASSAQIGGSVLPDSPGGAARTEVPIHRDVKPLAELESPVSSSDAYLKPAWRKPVPAVQIGSSVLPNALGEVPHTDVPIHRDVRPLAEVQSVWKRNTPGFNTFFSGYFASHPKVKPGRIKIEYVIASDGHMQSSRILSSDYADSVFESQLLGKVNALRFKNDPAIVPSVFTLSFGQQEGSGSGKPPKPERPVAEIDVQWESIKADVAKIFGDYQRSHPGVTAGQVGVAFTVAPDGRVLSSRITSSEYADKAFESQLLDKINTMVFRNDPGLAQARFTLSIGTPRKAAIPAEPPGTPKS